jgi:peptidylprolyl isomerase
VTFQRPTNVARWGVTGMPIVVQLWRSLHLGLSQGRRDPLCELGHPSAIPALVDREPDSVLPLTQLERPRLARKRQMIMTTSWPAAELSLGPDSKALTQALAERLVDAPGHRYLDHCPKRAELHRRAQRSPPFHSRAEAGRRIHPTTESPRRCSRPSTGSAERHGIVVRERRRGGCKQPCAWADYRRPTKRHTRRARCLVIVRGSRSMSRMGNWSLLVVSSLALGLAGCGSSSTSGTNPGSGGASAIASIPTADRSPAGTHGKAPTVVVPPGAPPTHLESADLIAGTGPAAKAGDEVTVQYVLATYSTREVIQSSWTSQSFQFTLGEGKVIPGWDQGVLGMKVGGRRELIIPPSLGYGGQSPGAGIAPNDTLVFVIDLLKIS